MYDINQGSDFGLTVLCFKGEIYSRIFIRVELNRVRCASALNASKGASKLQDLDVSLKTAEKNFPGVSTIFPRPFCKGLRVYRWTIEWGCKYYRFVVRKTDIIHFNIIDG